MSASLLDRPRQSTAGAFDREALAAEALASIEDQAAAVRKYCRDALAGKGETYLAKVAEARAWCADPAAPVPLLSADAGAMGITLSELAAFVLANATAWGMITGRIETARRAAIRAALQATNAAELRAAANINWRAVAGVRIAA